MLVCSCNLFQRSSRPFLFRQCFATIAHAAVQVLGIFQNPLPSPFFLFASAGLAAWQAAFPSCFGLANILGKPKSSTEGSLPFSCSFLFFLFWETKGTIASFFSPKALELFAFSKAEAFPKHHFSHPFPKEANPAAASHGQQAPWHPLTAQLRKVLAGHLFSRSPHASKCMWLLQPSGWPTPHHCGLWCSSVVS